MSSTTKSWLFRIVWAAVMVAVSLIVSTTKKAGPKRSLRFGPVFSSLDYQLETLDSPFTWLPSVP